MPLVFAGYWLLPHRLRNYWLLLASYAFYFSYNPAFLLLLAGTSGFDYWCARKIEQQPTHKRTFLLLSLLSNLGVLVAFKYAVFFYNTTAQLIDPNVQLLQNLVIPAGLSFYTFQSLSYTIDIYRGKYRATDTLWDFLLYVSFFPHMVAGPVVRYNSLMPQFKVPHFLKHVDWGGFATLTAWGYFKKLVIADNLNLVIGPVFASSTTFTGAEWLITGLLFVIQLYCDFSGYSDIATGIAKLFGIELSLNWRRPLLSTSLVEFWQRNHISITTWFRDYLYVGLGGNRVSPLRWRINLLLVFLISGLWHGANFTFVVWGLLHGVFFVAEKSISQRFPAHKAPKPLAYLYLLVFHSVALLAFRANSLTDLWYIYRKIFSASPGYFEVHNLLALQDKIYFAWMCCTILLLFLKELNEEHAVINRYPAVYRVAKQVFYLGIVVLVFITGNFGANTFIYFQF